jgi:hypothetical protein
MSSTHISSTIVDTIVSNAPDTSKINKIAHHKCAERMNKKL